MYQTVGQDAIQLVADALEIPLVRKVISGAAIQQGAEYGDRASDAKQGVRGDETEDLFDLLSDVKVDLDQTPNIFQTIWRFFVIINFCIFLVRLPHFKP